MARDYHKAEQNPPEIAPTDIPYRAPEPGLPSTPPDGPIQEPPMPPPGTDIPPGTSIPSPISL
jgi:hypothetical protein